MNDQPKVADAIRDTVKTLYGPTEAERKKIVAMSQPVPSGERVTRGAQQPFVGGVSLAESAKSPSSTVTNWTVRVRSKLYQFGTSYAVLIFIGPPPAAEHDWRTSPAYVDSFAVFVNPHLEGCANCRSHVDDYVEGFVPLSSFLCDDPNVSYFDSDVVVPYLKESLHWRIQTVQSSIRPWSFPILRS